jgi:hypothetical protein
MTNDDKEYYSGDDDRAEVPAFRPITPITPFPALSDDDEVVAVRVIGICPSADDPDVFEFVVIKQAGDGEAWVAIAESISCDLVAQSLP